MKTRWSQGLVVIAIVAGGLVVLLALALFMFGEDLFGSDRGTIDSYNREVLSSCELPPDSTLVRTYILGEASPDGERLRSLTDVYASPLDAHEVAAFFGLAGPGDISPVSLERACRFEQQPRALVLSWWTPDQNTVFDSATQTKGLPADPDDPLWGGREAEVTERADIPEGTRSFVGLRLAQREVDGALG